LLLASRQARHARPPVPGFSQCKTRDLAGSLIKEPEMPDIKLTDTQRVILSAASARDSGSLLPLPKSLTINKAAISKVLQSLLGKALTSKRPATLDEDAWEADGARIALEITAAGLAAIGIEPVSMSETVGKPKSSKSAKSRRTQGATGKGKPKPMDKPTRAAVAQPPKSSSKLSLVVAALRSRKGATIDDLIEATGWQTHSIRGAISGAIKKKLGLAVSSNAVEGRGRVYKIETTAK
jgi:Protein of unknown function (DUF3489)